MAVKTSRTDAFTWTLGAGVADTFQFLDAPHPAYVTIFNSDATNTVWVRDDGTTVVAAADGAIPVHPISGSRTFLVRTIGGVVTPLSIISAGASIVTAIKATRSVIL